MIHIEYDPVHVRIRVRGHAQYAPEGQDIVCAGVSALYETLVIHPLTMELPNEADEMWSEVDALSHCRSEMRPLFELIARGMEAISEEYPGHVRYRMVFA